MIEESFPEITVIIPFYGEYCDFEYNCLRSLEVQTFRDFEVILIQDGPSPFEDKIRSALEKSQLNFQYLCNENNRGALISRIIASHSASGRYIACLDHDDSYPPDFLEKLHRTATDKDVDIVECPLREIHAGECFSLIYRFECGKMLFGDDVLKAYFSMKSHNNLFNKLVRKSTWDLAAKDIERSFGALHLNYFEDGLMTISIFDSARSYVSVCDTHYNYQVRAGGSNMSTSSIDAIAKVIPKLDLVFGYIQNRFASKFGYGVMGEFAESELMYAVNHWSRALEKNRVSTVHQAVQKCILKFRLARLRRRLEYRYRLRATRA